MRSDPQSVAPEVLLKAHPEAWTAAKERARRLLTTAKSSRQVEAHARELARAAATASWRDRVAARLELHAITIGLRQGARAASGKGATPSQLASWVVDRLLFKRDRSRRVPDARLFRGVWGRIGARERAVLATTIQSLGIYSVHTKQFVRALKALIAGRPTLEVGAGDGSLAEALHGAGVSIRACDDRSWGSRVRCPDWVENAEAAAACKDSGAQVVICAWPPPGNRFERSILLGEAGAMVDLYVVVVGAEDRAAGDFRAYRDAERDGSWIATERRELAAALMPPELGCRVLVFERTRIKVEGAAAPA